MTDPYKLTWHMMNRIWIAMHTCWILRYLTFDWQYCNTVEIPPLELTKEMFMIKGRFTISSKNHEHVKLFSTHQLLCVAALQYNRCHWRKVVWSSIASHYKDMILLCMLGACTWILNTSWISLKSTVSSSCSIFTWLESQEAGEIRFVKHVKATNMTSNSWFMSSCT